MAQKFTTKISEKSKEQILAEIKAGKVSNCFKSSCPWTDGQDFEFDKIVLMDWENGTQSGSYLAIKPKNSENTLAISSALKEVFAYESADDAKNKVNARKFTSSGGLCDVLKGHSSMTEDLLNAIETYGKNNLIIRLVKYYDVDRFDRPREHYLVNLVIKQ